MPNKNLPELKSEARTNSTYFIGADGKTSLNYRESSGVDESHTVHSEPCLRCDARVVWSYMPPLNCDKCGASFKSMIFI